MRMVLVFDEWLGEIERRRPERAFARIKGSKDIMAGDIYDYEPWFRDGGGRDLWISAHPEQASYGYDP